MPHKNRFLLLVMLAASNFACAGRTEFKVCDDAYSLDISEKWVSVEKNGAEILRKPVPPDLAQAAFIADFNFDKIPDFALIRDSGIERYFDVYIFDKKRGGYFLNKQISSFACPSVDAEKKYVLSTCNHASACDSWQDSYQYKNGKLHLARREGTTCDPSTGQGYKYVETYKNGRIIKHEAAPISK